MRGRLRLGLFGGSFDPVHCGHVQLARSAWKECGLDRVIFIPARRPPHKRTKRLASAARRLEMLALALAPYPEFDVSRYELGRRSTTYTYQTVGYFRSRYPDAELFFIMGSDSLAELHTWKRAGLLQTLCGFIVGKRPGVPVPGPVPPSAHLLSKPILPVSSSLVRERIREGASLRGLVPPDVGRYVREHGLYLEAPKDVTRN